MEKKHECCTPEGQVPRYVDCVGCDKKPIEGATLSYAEAQKDSFSIMEKKLSSITHIRSWVRTNGEMSEDGKSITYSCAELEAVIRESLVMHKEDVKESYREGRTDQQSSSDSFYNRNAESYYNEKFGGE